MSGYMSFVCVGCREEMQDGQPYLIFSRGEQYGHMRSAVDLMSKPWGGYICHDTRACTVKMMTRDPNMFHLVSKLEGLAILAGEELCLET